MKKILISLLSTIIIFNNIFFGIASAEVVAGPDFVAKIATAGDDTYATNLSSISTNSDIKFQIITVADNNVSGNFNYSISFPAGFQYISSSVGSSNDCTNTSINNTVSSNFSYSFSGLALPCTSELYFTYRPTVGGNYSINILDVMTSQVVKTINLSINGNNSITRAQTLDTNANGYIDGYKLTFTNNIAGTFSNTNLKVGTLTPTLSGAVSGNIAYLSFTDGIYNSGDLPQIIDTDGGMFISVGIIDNNTINEEDSASPQLIRLNNTTLSSIGAGQSVNIGTGNLVLEFSERMSPTSTGAFTLNKGGVISGAYTYNAGLDKLTFVPSSVLTAGTYSMSANSNAKDWSDNNTITQPISLPSLIVPDTTAPIGKPLGNGTGVMINLGSTYTNNISVQLSILASDDMGVNDMMISNNSLFTGNSWENYSTNKNNWQLTSGTGTKTVYVKFRDGAGNTSPTYSENIVYDNTPNYISFDPLDSVYTNGTSITLSGGCNNISSTGVVLDTTINETVNGTPIGSINCTAGRTWSQSFNITAGATNTILLSYASDSSINNSVQIINPIPTCSSVTNGTVTGTYPSCSFTCNSGYTKVGGSCIANSCGASTQVIGGHTYSVPAIANGATSTTITSAGVSIANGTITYNSQFSCNLGTVSQAGIENYNAPSCNVGYYASLSSCFVQSSPGGGGGGGGSVYTPRDSCPSGDFSGNYYDRKCDTPTSSTGAIISTGATIPGTTITSSGVTGDINYQPISDIKELQINNLDSTFFKNLGESYSYVESAVNNQKSINLAKAFKNKLTFEGIEYYITYDKDFTKEYNNTLNAYALFVTQMDKYYSGDNSTTIKTNIALLYKKLLAGINLIKAESEKPKIWFTDAESSFALKDIIYLALKGVIKGYEDNTFRPNNPISRAEYLGVIMKALNTETDSTITTTVYSDIPKGGEWMIKYVEKAREFGINGQTKNGKKYFRPNDVITRAEAMAMLFSVSKIPVDDIQITEFSDIPTDALWMVKYIEKARELGIISGQTVDGKLIFRPNDPISRAESSRVLTKTLDSLNK